jgi:glycosyltransferase involved in cell wall biosynthesis
MKTVLIIQEHLPAFRVGFYQTLKAMLETRGIRLRLIYAPNQKNTFQKGELDWAEGVPIRWFGTLGWQPALGAAREVDLVIVQQETKYLLNPVLQLLAALGGTPVAYWGHGRNFQASKDRGLARSLKNFLARRVHWWFAYNDLSANIVKKTGFPAERITSVKNAIDTSGLRMTLQALGPDEMERARKELGFKGDKIAVYTGGLYPLKRIGFLLQACLAIRRRVPEFEIVFIGSGPDSALVEAASREHEWIQWVGPKSDSAKVPYWALSRLLLMPGGVGLVILDSFALGVPMVTTREAGHGPEIDYLKHGENGLMVEAGEEPERYAEAVSALLQNEDQLAVMRKQALEDGKLYSVETMAALFAGGVEAALTR